MSARLPNAAERPEREALTAREIDVLCHLARGYSYSRTAESLGISPHTVTSHIKNAYRKLDVHSAAAAVMRAIQLRLLGEAQAPLNHGMGLGVALAYDGSREGP